MTETNSPQISRLDFDQKHPTFIGTLEDMRILVTPYGDISISVTVGVRTMWNMWLRAGEAALLAELLQEAVAHWELRRSQKEEESR